MTLPLRAERELTPAGSRRTKFSPIAIVGGAGRFPGAPNLHTLWRNVVSRESASREIPPDRWPVPPETVLAKGFAPDKLYSTRACLLDPFDLDPSDLERAGLDPTGIESLDPLHRLVLRVGLDAWQASPIERIDRARVGIVPANIALPTDATSSMADSILGGAFDAAFGIGGGVDPRRGLGAPAYDRHPSALPAGLLGIALGLGGGSYTLDAACASSLYAIHLACLELQSRRADAVLAGGVSRPQCLYTQLGFSQLQALSPSGVCAPFDRRADGLVVGEGAGIFLLKRLEDAIDAGDPVLGVIRGIGLSNDVGGSLLSPDSEGQLRAMRQAYAAAGWTPPEVGLIECHGTGTPRGDAVEITSLRALWGEAPAGSRAVIGSVKSNVGHLLTAAGAAGLAKVLLALRARTLPPSANFARESAAEGLAGSPFRVLEAPESWESTGPRRAAVSAFGFGGINAHLLVEEHEPAPTRRRRKRPPTAERPAAEPEPVEPVAIVGIGARAGRLAGADAFRRAIFRGEPVTDPRPTDRWKGIDEALLETDPVRGAWIERVEVPVGRFKLPPREVPSVLPQQLLMLEVAAEALADAERSSGDRERDEARLRTGAVVGLGLDLETTSFHARWALRARAQEAARARGLLPAEAERWVESVCDALGPPLDAQRTLGNLGGIVASRLAREFRLGGPSFVIANEEGSGLRALEAACRLLQRHDADAIVVGAVDLAGDVRQFLATDSLRPYTRTSPSRPFDREADGPAIGEGAMALVVKRLADATRDGDRIYAVVRGIGAASGALADAYARALERAYGEAGVEPRSVALIEGHGSGAPEEDKAELGSLARFFPVDGPRRCAVGSAKAVVGHLGAAAGLASVAKAALCLFHELLPPMPAYRSPSDAAFDAHPFFHVPREPQAWLRDRADGPRRAGVSAVSIDGTCLHAVLEAVERPSTAYAAERARPLGERSAGLFLLRASGAARPDADEALRRLALEHAEEPIESLAARWYRRGATGPVSRALVAESAPDLLQQLARGRDAAASERGGRRLSGGLAFVFPGSGSDYLGMGRSLAVALPAVYRRQDEECLRLGSQLVPETAVPWRSSWSDGWEREASARLAEATELRILAQVAHGTAVADAARLFGLKPDAMIGYSLGESAALFASRAWTARDEMFERTRRSTLFRTDLAGPCEVARAAWGSEPDWFVAVVNRPAETVRASLAGTAALLIVNAPQECVIGGRRPDVERTVAALGCESVALEGVPTVHFPLVSAVADRYRELHRLPTRPPTGVRFYSGAWGESYVPSEERAAESILANAIGGFDFQKTIERAYADGVRIFVEMGPGASCTRMIGKILAGREHLAVTACQRGQDGYRALLGAVAKVAEAGVEIDLGAVYAEGAGIVIAEGARRAEVVAVEVGGGRRLPKGRGAEKQAPPAAVAVTAADAVAEAVADVVAVPVAVPVPVAVAEAVAEPEAESESVAESDPRPVPGPRPSPKPRPWEDPSTNGLPQQGHPSVADSAWAATATPAAFAAGVALAMRPLPPGVPSPLASAAAAAAAHEAFLQLNARYVALQREALLEQQRMIEALARALPSRGLSAIPANGTAIRSTAAAATTPTAAPAFDRALCMEFAIGSIGKMLGPRFADVDAHPTRVRLPDEPLMLVDRIVEVEGEPDSMTSGAVVTEHDVVSGAWYLDGGRAPVCISVEAGQADLFLSGYLGIDHQTKGLRVYRLLDAKIVFHRDLPVPGETIRYDIRIDRFIRQGETWLFFFRFDGTIAGSPFITMYDGCAGFFSDAQLREGRGIVGDLPDERPARRLGPDGKPTAPFTPLVPKERERYDDTYGDAQVEALRRGDLAACFGPAFDGLSLDPRLRLPSGRMRLVDRIVDLDPDGGRFGLGQVIGEADIHPDDWFLTCHFSDDPVMPGTLMYECCLHTLRVLLLRMGWIATDGDGADLHYAPVEGIASRLRCRGQVIPETKKVTYRIELKEIGYDPEPYVLADASMFADGRHVVEMESMSVRVRGLTKEGLERFWAARAETPQQGPPSHAVADSVSVASPVPVAVPASAATPAAASVAPLFSREQILAYSIGDPSACFGEPYRVFDKERRLARLPGPPYLFVDRVTACEPKPWILEPGGWVTCEYDVPPDAWYFRASGQPVMPFAVLLEAALQPCGWLAAYLGSALTSDDDLHFRNLDGTATAFREVTPSTGTLTMRARLTKTSQAGGMILQKFDMEILAGRDPVYRGNTDFGFFPASALAQQVGIRGAERWKGFGRSFGLPRLAPVRPDDAVGPPPAKARLALPATAFSMVDRIDALSLDGGPNGFGFVAGSKKVDPDEWFFAAHFYQDPVMPGSLGLEALIQLLKVYARERYKALAESRRFQVLALGREHRWTYRGQVLPSDRLVTVAAQIVGVEEGPEPVVIADGQLAVDGRVIYSMKRFALRLVEDT